MTISLVAAPPVEDLSDYDIGIEFPAPGTFIPRQVPRPSSTTAVVWTGAYPRDFVLGKVKEGPPTAGHAHAWVPWTVAVLATLLVILTGAMVSWFCRRRCQRAPGAAVESMSMSGLR